jgi:hypothetical protein
VHLIGTDPEENIGHTPGDDFFLQMSGHTPKKQLANKSIDATV